MQWIETGDPRLQIDGLPFHRENGGRFCRLPLRAEGVVRPEIWWLAQMPSGGRIRFRSDTTSLSLRIAHSVRVHMDNMPLIGHSGIDVYVGGPGAMRCWGTTRPDGEQTAYERSLLAGLAPEEREYTLYLPTYNDLTRLEIGLSDGARILPSASRYAVDKPVVFYGSSITQSGCATRPGNGYVPIVGRNLNLDVVNLGFSGNGLGEPEVARFVAEIDAACFVLDFHCNVATVEGLRAVYEPFYRTLRERHPCTPILMVSMICTTFELHDPGAKARRLGQRDVILQTHAKARREGDQQVYFLDGADLIGPEADGAFVDGIHPNDRGFFMMADGLTPVLKRVLGLA